MVPLKILVIDDDDVSRELLEMLLTHHGYCTLTAHSGEQALTLLEGTSLPDAILTDLQMPGLSGSSLAAEFRRHATTTRLVAMSGSAPAADVIESYDGFLLKPFRIEALEEILARGSQSQAAAASSEQAEHLIVLDQGVYRKLRAAMPPERLTQLYELCLNDVRRRVAAMSAAAETGDDALYRKEAHAIKGGCGMVGASELQTIATTSENNGIPANHVATCHEFIEAVDRLERMLFAHGHTKEISSAVESARSTHEGRP